MPEFYIIVSEPKYPGNLGAIARAMANFDFKNLYLINPCDLNDECYQRAMHADKILDSAKIFSEFKESVKNLDFLVATSSIENKTDKKHLRSPIFLEDFSKKIYDVEGKIGIVFGREDYGLFNEEIALCDIMVKIPTSDTYPSLNLSHAVGLVLYHLFINDKFQPREKRNISDIEKQKINEHFSKLLEIIDYPDHKKEKTEIMFRRILGRAMPSKWEYHTLMGVLSRSIKKIKEDKKTK